ncbi:MAG TPA: hypothetical protein VF215_14295 [Thermoanaerobaculia bacterium]
MTRGVRQVVLGTLAGVMALLLALFLANLDLVEDTKRPEELEPLAAWLAKSPADWLAASAITDVSLDSALPLDRRIALWRSGFVLARYLAPLRANPSAGFVRAGLFHWYELGPDDRKLVLQTATPMLRDPAIFAALHRPLWELTRDLGYLRRSAPPTINALWMLRELAIASGDFAEYRTLRTTLRDARMHDFQSKRATATIAELIAIVPQAIAEEDEDLVRGILEEIDRRPFDVELLGNRIEDITIFAIEHHLHPLTALKPLIEIQGKLRNPTRARLAIALGDRSAAQRIELLTGATSTPEWVPYHLERAEFEEREGEPAMAQLYRTRAAVAEATPKDLWTNLCGRDELCTSVFRVHEGPLHFKLAPAQTDEIPPYVEVYVDDALVGEGEVRGSKAFDLTAAGRHRIEVRLINRVMRNGTQRRVRLS